MFEPTGNGRVNVVWNSPVNLFQRLRQPQPCPRDRDDTLKAEEIGHRERQKPTRSSCVCKALILAKMER